MNLGYLLRCGGPHWALILIGVLIHEANFTIKRINSIANFPPSRQFGSLL